MFSGGLVNGAIYLVNGITSLPVLISFLFGVGMIRVFYRDLLR
jgi:hypothetical protein